MERFFKRKEPDSDVTKAPGIRPEDRLERKRGPQPQKKDPDAIELPKKVRKTSRIAELEQKLNELTRAAMSSGSGSSSEIIEKRLKDQDEIIFFFLICLR